MATVPLLHWVLNTLGNNYSDTLYIKKQHTLVTSGPYRRVRHPMYSVIYLFLIGMFILSTIWLLGLFGIFAFILISYRNGKEEAMLIEAFGDEYRAYMKHTGRFLPRLLA